MTSVSRPKTQLHLYSGNPAGVRPGLRTVARVILESLPWLGDVYYRRWVFPRRATACRGVFHTREEAEREIPSRVVSHYDACNEVRSVAADAGRQHTPQYEDYPVLYWLQPLIRNGVRITDLGGSTGATFYAFDRELSLPRDLRWTVVELEAAVKTGTQVAEIKGEDRLRFTTDFEAAPSADVLLTIGALQYLPKRLAVVLSRVDELPRHVIIHKVPVYDGPPYWTIQNLEIAQVPYFVHNRDTLVEEMTALGYRLVDSCNVLRSIRIPFRPDRDVNYYGGFFFALDSK